MEQTELKLELTKRGRKKVTSWEIHRLTKQYVAIGPAPNPVIHIIQMLKIIKFI